MTLEQTVAEAISLRKDDPAKAKEMFRTILHSHAETPEAEVAQMHLDLMLEQEKKERERITHKLALDEETRKTEEWNSKPAMLRRAAKWCVVVPWSAFAIGLLLTSILPGCTVDTGRGAVGCEMFGTNFGGLIVLLASFGFFFGLLGTFLVAPVLLFWSQFAPKKRKTTRKKREAASKRS